MIKWNWSDTDYKNEWGIFTCLISWTGPLISMDQQSRRVFIQRFSQWVFFCRVCFFSLKLFGFMSKAIKLLLTELVSQCRNLLPFAFSSLTSLRSANREKTMGIIFLHWPPTQLMRVYQSTGSLSGKFIWLPCFSVGVKGKPIFMEGVCIRSPYLFRTEICSVKI